MDHAALVRVLDRGAQVQEDLDPLTDREPVGIAVGRDGLPWREVHDEVGPPPLRRPGVEDPRDGRVIEEREGLPLGLESRDHLARIHAQLDDLQGHLPPQGDLLHRAEDHPEAPLAELLVQAIRTHRRADLDLLGGRLPGGLHDRARLEEAGGGLVGLDEGGDLRDEIMVMPGGVLQPASPGRAFGSFQRTGEEPLEGGEARLRRGWAGVARSRLAGHSAPSLSAPPTRESLSSLKSHARANAQLRSAVARDTPRTSAASTIDRPAKNRSSTSFP